MISIYCRVTKQDDEEATDAVEASSTGRQKGVKHPSGDITKCPDTPATSTGTGASSSPLEGKPGSGFPPASWERNVGLVIGSVFFIVVGVVIGRWSATRSGYYNLSDPV